MSFIVADFGQDENGLYAAARRLRAMGHRKLDAYSPYPLHGVDEALGLKRSVVPLIALVAGVGGAAAGYYMQYWMNAVDWAINVGNRPPHSPPANIPITFETAVLVAALCIVLGLFALSGFPRPHHPVFEVENFRSASIDALWLSAEVSPDDAEVVVKELRSLGARQVERVATGEEAR